MNACRPGRYTCVLLAALVPLAILRAQIQPEAGGGGGDPATLERGDALLRFSLAQRAEAVYRAVIEQTPDGEMAHLGLARALLLDGRAEEAATVCRGLIGKGPASDRKALANAILGQALWASGKAEAKAAYELALAPADGLQDPLAQRARFLATRGLATLEWRKAEGSGFVLLLPPDTKLTQPEGMLRACGTIASRLNRCLGWRSPGRITLYCFNNPEQWRVVLGEHGGEGVEYDERVIYYTLGRTMYNPAMALSFYTGADELKGPPACPLLANGLAAYVAGGRNWGGRVDSTAPSLLRNGGLAPLSDLLKSTSSDNTLAATGGSLVKFLVAEKGAEAFRRLWLRYNDGDGAFQDVYGVTVEEVDAQWREWLGEAPAAPPSRTGPGPLQPTGEPVTADTTLQVGDAVQTEWQQQWWAAQVIGLDPDGRVKVHYVGWDASWDEVVTRERLRQGATAAGRE